VRQQDAYLQTRGVRLKVKLCATPRPPFQGQHLRLYAYM